MRGLMIFAVALATLAVATSDVFDEDAKPELAARMRQFTETYSSGEDGAGCAAFFTEDGALLAPGNAAFNGREEITSAITSLKASLTGLTFVETTDALFDSNNLGAISISHIDGTAADGTMPKFRDMVIWMKVDAQWQIYRYMFQMRSSSNA